MSQPLLLMLFGSLCFLLLAGSLLLMPHLRRHEGMQARLQQVRLDGQASAPITRPSGPLLVRFEYYRECQCFWERDYVMNTLVQKVKTEWLQHNRGSKAALSDKICGLQK